MGRQSDRGSQAQLLGLAVLLSLGPGLLIADLARAQDTIRLYSLVIDLWPEFDRPATLVILDATLEPDVLLPAELTVRIPAAAGPPHAVAARGADGGLFNIPFTATPLGDAIVVTLTADNANFRVEYYDPALRVSGEERQYRFQWTPDYPVRAARLRVQQPAGARALSAEPALQLQGTGEYGLNYYGAELGALTPGQPVAVQLNYRKSDARLSAEVVAANGSVPDPGQTNPVGSAPATGSPSLFSPWLFGGLVVGLGLIALGALWYRRTNRNEDRPRLTGRKRRPRLRRGQAVAEQSGAPFCTQCGQRAQPGDQFCRICGTKLRA